MLWDRGTWEPVGDPHEGLKAGKLVFRLHGKRLRGEWALIRLRTRKPERQEPWLLIKAADAEADEDRDVLAEFDESVETACDLPGDRHGRVFTRACLEPLGAGSFSPWAPVKAQARPRAQARRARAGHARG